MKRNSGQVAAFFDFDGTVASTTAVHHYFYLMSVLRASSLHYWNFLIKLTVYFFVEKISRSVFDRLFYRNYSGLDVVICRSVFLGELKEHLLGKVYSEALYKIQMHKNAGHKLILITGSPDFVVKPIAEHLGFCEIVCAGLQYQEGIFNGCLSASPLHKEEKAHAIKRIASQKNLDLKNCYAYGDSINDYHMLSSVGNAIAINPDLRLRRLARKNHWPVYYWKKGML